MLLVDLVQDFHLAKFWCEKDTHLVHLFSQPINGINQRLLLHMPGLLNAGKSKGHWAKAVLAQAFAAACVGI